MIRTAARTLLLLALPSPAAAAIPAFARKYRTSCSTCHTAAPKLNVLGEAFRLNGYRFPENDLLLRREAPVALGEEPWREVWPRAIWPGEVPGSVPLALRVQLDARATQDRTEVASTSLMFPEDLYILAGGTLGDNIGVFVEGEWNRDEGARLVQAKLHFQDVLPLLPERALNAWVGLQSLYLLTFGERQIDRLTRQPWRWQVFRARDVEPVNPVAGDTLHGFGGVALGGPQPAIVLNGLLSPRLFWAAGLTQGGAPTTTDNDNHKDLFWHLRWKPGGLRLDGRYDTGQGPADARGGQLLDHSLILEQFAYFGADSAPGGGRWTSRTYGLAARVLAGRLDAGGGVVWGRDRAPWGSGPGGTLTRTSVFARAEVMLYPWLLASLRAEDFEAEADAGLRASGYTGGNRLETRLMPGVTALVRQNVRLVAEAEWFARHTPSADAGLPRPHALWLRLDVAF